MINLQPEDIKPLRKNLKLSYIDLEILTGISRVKISNIERLKKVPAPHELQLIAEAFNKIEKLLSKKEVKTKTPKVRIECDCGAIAYSNGLCYYHYQIKWRHVNREAINRKQREKYHRLKNESINTQPSS